jgi:hypothetical protein
MVETRAKTSHRISFALGVILCCGCTAVALVGCSEEDQPTGKGDPFSGQGSFDYENTLVFKRSSGTEIDFSTGFYCYCDEWESSNVPDWTFHVIAGFDPGGHTVGDPGWRLKIVVADVTLDEPINLPVNFIWDQPEHGSLFILDPPNELSSAADDCSGSITIHRLICGNDGGIEFSIDAVIGSEFHGGGSVTVTGSFVAPHTGGPVLSELPR